MGTTGVLENNAAVEGRCQAVEAKAALDQEAVDRAIAGIRRPRLVRERLGHAILYAQRVEAEVAQLPIDRALPHRPESYMGRFLRVWTPDEVGHGEAQRRLLEFLDLPVPEAVTDDLIASHVAGLLARASSRLYAMISLTYHTVGAMNEKLAMTAYHAMAAIAAELGEQDLAETLFIPMRRDESLHLGYYRTYARELARDLQPWQCRAVRKLVVSTYQPVGARRDKHKASLGHTLLALEADPANAQISALTQAIAEDVLAQEGEPLPPFVAAAMALCVEFARHEIAEGLEPEPVPVR